MNDSLLINPMKRCIQVVDIWLPSTHANFERIIPILKINYFKSIKDVSMKLFKCDYEFDNFKFKLKK